MDSNEFSRREFLKRVLALSAAAALPTILTKNTLSAARPKPRIVGPNERVNLAVCGIGNRGGEILREFAKTGEANIVALCDVDMGAPHTEQSLKQFPNVPRFQDFRQMFDKMGDQIDAVSVGVPDFSHFPICMLAMSLGKHVYTEKPMARTFYEVELMMKAAKKYKVVNQMGNQGHSEGNYFQFKAWKDAGIIKDVTAITAHMNAPRRWHGWDTNIKSFPPGQPVPQTLDWNTWLMTARFHDYNKDYVNGQWRCWYDFGPQYKGGYRSWWGFETLPEVNEETPSFVEFITGEGGVIDTWLRRGAAGFRLDVADELPDAFIEKIRTAVKRVSPEKFLLGEVWEDATTKFGFDHRRTYLLGKGLDSVMNYPFKNSVLDFVKGKPAQQAANEILSICEHYPAPAINTALNFLSTHDTERALTVIADEPANGRGREWQSGRSVTGEAYEEGMLRLRMAYAIIYTLPGVPCLYYGDEIGMQGYRDPFNRAFFCWDSHEERLRPVLAQLAQLRHSCEAFRTGELRVLRAEDGILHYQRIGKTETAEIVVNRSEHIIVEPLASGKHTEVNPMGFTIVVEENGHNPNHSYYDIQ